MENMNSQEICTLKERVMALEKENTKLKGILDLKDFLIMDSMEKLIHSYEDNKRKFITLELMKIYIETKNENVKIEILKML